MEEEILSLINNSENIIIITHINPDGDTLGSASALKSYLNSINKKSDILIQIQDNFNFPNTYGFLPNINKAKNLSNITDEYDLAIAVDIASVDRMIDITREVWDKTKNTIAIDHHKTNLGYAKYNYIKGGISSTGEVLYDLLNKLKISIAPDIAIGLYTAILTDTGCFKYESTTPHTFNIAAKLAKAGINTSEIADYCYTNKPKNLILFQNYIISNAKFGINGKIAYTTISKEIFEKFSAKDEYTEGICETLRSISSVEIAFVAKESNTGTKVSIRTRELDATLIAKKFNGGGHKRAAGCTIKHKLNKAVELLLDEAKKIIKL